MERQHARVCREPSLTAFLDWEGYRLDKLASGRVGVFGRRLRINVRCKTVTIYLTKPTALFEFGPGLQVWSYFTPDVLEQQSCEKLKS